MKIALITDDYYPKLGGIANVLYNLHKYFLNKEPELYIFNPYLNGKYEYKLKNLIKFSILDIKTFIKHKKFYFFFLFSIWKIIRDNKIRTSHKINLILYFFIRPKEFIRILKNLSDLYPIFKRADFDLIVSGNSGWILPLVFILSRIFNKKLISIAFGNDFLIQNSLSLKTFYFRNLEKIIVITHKMKNLIKRMHHLNDDQIEVIRVGVNLNDLKVKESKEELRKEFNIPEEKIVLLSVGRHTYRKKFNLVIKAVKELKTIRPSINLKYFLIGEGKETFYLKELTKKLDLQNEVEFLGICSLEKRNKFYKLSDLFLMPSVTEKNSIEAFGIVFIEANYFKIPVIGSKTGGMIEAIIDGETGILIEPNNLNDLVEKILLLHDDNKKRRQLGENGYKRVLTEFTWDKIVDEYIATFQKVLKDV